MAQSEILHNSTELARARETFDPLKFGFEPHGKGFIKTIPGIGRTVFAPLEWMHAHFPATLTGDLHPTALDVAENIQEVTFGMEDRKDIIPAHLLGIVNDMGGSLLVAYPEDQGYTPDSWLGIGIIFNGKGNRLVSKFIGANNNVRGKAGIATNIRFLQAHLALKGETPEGSPDETSEEVKTVIEWVHDSLNLPMENLSYRKLGAVGKKLTLEKYGDLVYKIYGKVPTDRVTAEWNLLSERTHNAIKNIKNKKSRPLPSSLAELELVTVGNVAQVAVEKPDAILYELPADMSKLDQDATLALKHDIRAVLEVLMDTESADIPEGIGLDPAFVDKKTTKGAYEIDDFVTSQANGENRNFIHLRLKPEYQTT